MNIAAADAHVPEIERSIGTTKERTRGTIQGMPFRRIPRVMVNAIVERAIRGLNQFPARCTRRRLRHQTPDTISPLTIMTGMPGPDYNTFKIEFGSYAQVFEANDPTNTMRTHNTGAIALYPNDGEGGGYTFMSLVTGKELNRSVWTPLPMPEHVVRRVEAMGLAQGQPLMVLGEPIFEWAPGAPVEDFVDQPVEDEGANIDPLGPIINNLCVAEVPAVTIFDEDEFLPPDEPAEPDPVEEDDVFQEPDPAIEDPQEDGFGIDVNDTAEVIVPETVVEENGVEEVASRQH
jgi:hypothetical protein